MKRLLRKRSRGSDGTESQDGESIKALRRKQSEAKRSLRTLEKLKSPKFLKELQEKEDFYYFNLSLFKSESGQRFNEEIMRDPIFRAIRYCRDRSWVTKALEMIKAHPEQDFINVEGYPGLAGLARGFKLVADNPPDDLIELYDPEQQRLLASEFLTAAEQGKIARLKERVQLCEIQETTTFNRPRERQSDSKRWQYYVAHAAGYWLEKELVPNKKTVKDLAFITRLGDEFPYLRLPRDRWMEEWKQRMEQLRRLPEPKWDRIFRDLGLKDLPSAPTHPRY